MAQWFRAERGLVAWLLRPLSWLYGGLLGWSQVCRRRQARQRAQPACPVLVVGNLIVGGAGKTPTTIAIVQALKAAGHAPGVVSRGYGRSADTVLEVTQRSDVRVVGDEPLLIHRRSAAPLFVGRDRVAAAQRLLAAHPEVDLIVADDGLQHRQLRRDVEVIVFDERGVGNGLLLPAGPLREPFPAAPGPQAIVLYNHARPSTPWHGACAGRRLSAACGLSDWLSGRLDRAEPLSALRGRTLLAVAGIAVPERFFTMLEAAGLAITRLALPDHHRYDRPAWPNTARELITTEKDAVKLAAWSATDLKIWVVGLDLDLPADFVAELLARLPATASRQSTRVRP